MRITRNAVSDVVMAVLDCPDLKRATKYLDDKTTVKCTRQSKFDGRAKRHTFVLTVGAPNYEERMFIKLCKRSGCRKMPQRLLLKWSR